MEPGALTMPSLEDWIEADPLPCADCGRPYREHREGDEACPPWPAEDNRTSNHAIPIYCNPEALGEED